MPLQNKTNKPNQTIWLEARWSAAIKKFPKVCVDTIEISLQMMNFKAGIVDATQSLFSFLGRTVADLVNIYKISCQCGIGWLIFT